ncbi:MAG: type II toxin-antitoxin system HicB family antitoxin [Thermomicrobiales bacterium]|nr:type II toxin-antitoxin system HicB family antitoxin [Thermomicrobiales bacterium]
MVAQQADQDWATPEEREEARRYRMVMAWSDEDDIFIVRFPDAPGVVTHGATREEAAAQGDEAILGWLTALRDAGIPVPPPAPFPFDDAAKDWS